MTKGVVVKPIMSSEFASRGQVDLIDIQSLSQGVYKFITVYPDHLTKFCVLRPLTSKRAAEVAFQLADVFLMIGAPIILQSDNGSEFTAQIIKELTAFWPTLMLVHGKPRHPQSQGSVERANGDIKDMLVAWMPAITPQTGQWESSSFSSRRILLTMSASKGVHILQCLEPVQELTLPQHHYPRRPSAAYELNRISSQFFRILMTNLKSLMIVMSLNT